MRLHNDLTPATQWGPWVEWALALIAGLAVLASAGLAILHNGGLKRPEPEVEPASPTKET
ncbi:apolipoprotein N-acyltransferase [Mycobacteroides abscessus subsp. abscessus]|nr:apolipoprotein N-acyltransferase [Mycobacteroides abscessus subsp. abscessus]